MVATISMRNEPTPQTLAQDAKRRGWITDVAGAIASLARQMATLPDGQRPDDPLAAAIVLVQPLQEGKRLTLHWRPDRTQEWQETTGEALSSHDWGMAVDLARLEYATPQHPRGAKEIEIIWQ